MIMKKEQPKKEKTNYKSTVLTDDALYEMIYDRITNTTSYIKIDTRGQMEFYLEEASVGKDKYKPYPPTYNLIDKNVILFPSMAFPYENEEEILTEIRAFIHKYLDITETYEQIATYYVLFTWLYDKFNEVPYLRAIGDFGSGKSRFLQTIGALCYKPTFTGGATTTAPIFRVLDEGRGTLILDEADLKFSDMTTDIIKILNGGYQKGGNVLRMGGKTMEDLKAFDVFGPKVVATRETFSDKALESRFLVEEMGIGKLRPGIPRTLKADFYKDAEMIRNKLLMWRLKNYFSPVVYREELIEGIHPRLNQIVIPLLSIIQKADTRESLKNFIVEYNGELTSDRGFSWESDIVFAILKLEHDLMGYEVTVKEIAKSVNDQIDEDGETLTARKVGWYLRKRLQLKPYRRNRGYVLSFKTNRQKLDFWKERYGITDADIRGEEVNDVNNVNINEDIIKQQEIF
jgi:hypothetical protein